MPRVTFVQKARKAIPNAGIEKGDSYYWWKFRYGGKHVSKSRPRPSQLTQSSYLSTAYGLQEQIEDLEIDPEDTSTVADDLRNVAEEIRSLGEEQESNRSNMPDHLQDVGSGELLQQRAEACENVAGELESAADEIESIFDDKKGELLEEAKSKLEELRKLLVSRPDTLRKLKKLEIKDDDELESTLQEVADALADFPEDEKITPIVGWFEEAWGEMKDEIQQEVQDAINGVSWEFEG